MQVIIGCKVPYSEIAEGHLNKHFCDQCGKITDEVKEDKCPNCHYESCMYPFSEPVSKYFVKNDCLWEEHEKDYNETKRWYHPELTILPIQSAYADEHTELPEYLIFGLSIESSYVHFDDLQYNDDYFHKIEFGDIEKTKHVAQYLLTKEGLYSEDQFGIYTLS